MGKPLGEKARKLLIFNDDNTLNWVLSTKKRPHLLLQMWSGTPEGTRTPDLTVRSRALYPAELQAHIKLSVLTA